MKSRSLPFGLVALALLANSSAAARDCDAPLMDLSQRVDRPLVRYPLLGESQGAVDAPVSLGGAARKLSDHPPIVGIDWPADDRAALDRFMAQPDPDRALGLLMETPVLRRPDGGGRRIMIDLLKRMWRLRNGGRWVRLIPFDHDLDARTVG